MRKCKQCGHEVKKKRHLYCSTECKHYYYGIGFNKLCPFCEEYFTKEYKEQVYCTKKCKQDQKYKKELEKKNINCVKCGRETPVSPQGYHICDDCANKPHIKRDDILDFNETGQDLFVPGVSNEWQGLINPAL